MKFKITFAALLLGLGGVSAFNQAIACDEAMVSDRVNPPEHANVGTIGGTDDSQADKNAPQGVGDLNTQDGQK